MLYTCPGFQLRNELRAQRKGLISAFCIPKPDKSGDPPPFDSVNFRPADDRIDPSRRRLRRRRSSVRVWELSSFSFIPGQLSAQEMKYPTLFRDLAYRQQANSGIIDSGFWKKYARTPLYEHGFVRRELKTKSVYSPALLLPQALIMRFGRSLSLPVCPYGMRVGSPVS